MAKIAIYTQAYNAENTLGRTVESVLNQTFSDFKYYILDNGSLDKTRDIILDYAKRDCRVVPLFRQYNHVLLKQMSPILSFAEDLCHNDYAHEYFANIDADDEYHLDFFEKTLEFMNENQLDVASCGTEWVDSRTREVVKHRVPDENIILEGPMFANQFPVYRNFTTTIWGKIYKTALLRKCDFSGIGPFTLIDSPFCLEAFRCAKRAGVLAKTLHRYYLSPAMDSRGYSPYWFRCYKNLYKTSRNFLLSYGEISKKNEDYLYVVFFTLIRDILKKIENYDVDLSVKLKNIYDVLADETTQYVLEHWSEVGIHTKKAEFLQNIRDWISSQPDWYKFQASADKILAVI